MYTHIGMHSMTVMAEHFMRRYPYTHTYTHMYIRTYTLIHSTNDVTRHYHTYVVESFLLIRCKSWLPDITVIYAEAWVL